MWCEIHEADLVSECCGATPVMDVDTQYSPPLGFCGMCLDNACFECQECTDDKNQGWKMELTMLEETS